MIEEDNALTTCEQVYPLRHQQLFAQEEKLQQLYTSKLEQLNALTTRLSNLASTLGPTFFSDDVLNPTPSAGELSGTSKPSRNAQNADDSVGEEAMLRDVTPERFNRIEKELIRGKNEISRRLISLSALFEQIAWLYTELGIPLPRPGEPVPSSKEFPYPRPFRSAVAGRQDPFVVAPTPDPERQRREYFPLFSEFVGKLQEAEEGREVGGVEGVDPTLVLIEWFEHLKTDVRNSPWVIHPLTKPSPVAGGRKDPPRNADPDSVRPARNLVETTGNFRCGY